MSFVIAPTRFWPEKLLEGVQPCNMKGAYVFIVYIFIYDLARAVDTRILDPTKVF